MSNKEEKENVLLENENYRVEVTDDPKEEGEKTYAVTNVKTDVVEMRSPVLPQAYMFAEDFNDALLKYEAEKANSDAGIQIVPANDSALKPH